MASFRTLGGGSKRLGLFRAGSGNVLQIRMGFL